jgi:uncharacterized protein (DUF2252 family)
MADPTRNLRPSELASWQRELDEARMRWMPKLLSYKRAKVEASPFSFLRGSAPLFYRILRKVPRLARGPSDRGILCGDLHLENFGAYRPDRPRQEHERVVFGLNDFDDAFAGPLHLDVLRLLTSTLLAAPGWGSRGRAVLDLTGAVLDGYQRGRTARGRTPLRPPPVEALLSRVAGRKRKALLDSRTRIVDGRRRFTIGPRYWKPGRALEAACRRGFQRYVAQLEGARPILTERLEIQDLALRIAGTGSVGALRVAVLVRGRGGRDGSWMFEMKEEDASAGEAFAVRSLGDGPTRVINAMRAGLRRPPLMLGETRVAGHRLLVRRLTPQEDRLDWAKLEPRHQEPTLSYVGWLAGAMHRRTADQRLAPLSPGDLRHLLFNAIELAGLHEAVALSHSALVRDDTAR